MQGLLDKSGICFFQQEMGFVSMLSVDPVKSKAIHTGVFGCRQAIISFSSLLFLYGVSINIKVVSVVIACCSILFKAC